LLLLTLTLAKEIAGKGKQLTAMCMVIVVFCAIYLSMIYLEIPGVFLKTSLFSGYIYSLNSVVPSLGHLFLLSIMVCSAAYFSFRYFPLRLPFEGRFILRWFSSFLLFSILSLLLILIHYIFRDLILGSNICFEPYRVLNLSLNTVFGIISILLLFIAVFLMIPGIVKSAGDINRPAFALSFILPGFLFFLPPVSSLNETIPLAFLYISIILTLTITSFRNPGIFNLSVLFSLFLSFYFTSDILEHSDTRATENKKVLAVSYSTENDPEAEHLLLDIWPEFSADTIIKAALGKEQILQEDIDILTSYLQGKYFGGYWGNFRMSVVTCSDDSPLYITSEDSFVDNCFDFFSERLKKYGHQITGTGFWYLENQGGRSYYMGQILYPSIKGRTNGLFIDLFSDADAFQPGYSELLLDKKYQGYVRLRDYSFARYINGNLVLSTGDFPYDKTDNQYIDKEYDYRLFNMEGFKHVLYRNGNATVIISEKRVSTVDVIISFAYLFAFTLLLTNLLQLLSRRPSIRSVASLDFRQKLQVTFIALLLFSFIAVGVTTASLSIRQFQDRHLDNIKEKVASIYTELENNLSFESELTSNWRDESNPSLNELLISLSNVFNTDINLYYPNGFLMATSRPEVFYRDLTSRRLNMDALINLENLTKPEYIQRERIASLEFVSAYVPFYNVENKLLAWLNLPYFRMQSVLAREISNVIVAVINFTLLLIVLSMIAAVIISRTLTSPLRMLLEGMASVELGKKSEHLVYKGHDEISEMVKQYNKMVDELQESAKKLANSEREFAWREMAKQVAHEIKNPLTPMKLNIQQLYKSWKDDVPGFEQKLEKFTRNQIEYIEALSYIASAFSSFAKLPAPNPAEVNLCDQIRTVLELFRDEENISFHLKIPDDTKVMVMADKEHLTGIFSNLIKNAIQAIPAGRNGLIKISMEVAGNRVLTSVEDNGSGINQELGRNLFTPNFTTKSSGMGLGLSIVKRYAESAGGRVWFESEPGRGSVFFVELPVIYTVERLG
jgi:signal transduction histidine kinase